MSVNDFLLFAARIDNYNLFTLQKFIDNSQLVRKLNGFTEKYEEQAFTLQVPPPHLYHSLSFPCGLFVVVGHSTFCLFDRIG